MWRNFLNLLLILLPILFLVYLLTQKDKLTNYLSKEMKSQTESGTKKLIGEAVDSLYNYRSNKQTYYITFLEFGAKGCVACRKMEVVLDEVRAEYPEKIKVVFLNILQAQNQEMMKYYGVVAIPTQILLDQNGVEYFRHTGYYSFDDLKKKLLNN